MARQMLPVLIALMVLAATIYLVLPFFRALPILLAAAFSLHPEDCCASNNTVH
jgi:hypothetical protein